MTSILKQVIGFRLEVIEKIDYLKPRTYNLTPNFNEGEI